MRGQVVPPPAQVQRRAWECAFVLRHDFDDRLPIEARIRAEVAMRIGPHRLGWRECGEMFALFGAAVEVRA